MVPLFTERFGADRQINNLVFLTLSKKAKHWCRQLTNSQSAPNSRCSWDLYPKTSQVSSIPIRKSFDSHVLNSILMHFVLLIMFNISHSLLLSVSWMLFEYLLCNAFFLQSSFSYITSLYILSFLPLFREKGMEHTLQIPEVGVSKVIN